MGYCIICGKIIPKDINKPFCKSCYAPYQEVAISSWISGRCCHYCRNEKEKISNHYPLCNECKPFSRHDNSINDSFLQNINEFKNMSLSDRQNIEPLWLSQESKICNNSKYNIVLHELNISEIIKIIETTSNLNTANIFENEPKDNRRIMNILRAWKQKKSILPPTVVFEDSIFFTDGRHRSLAAHFLGVKTIPVYCKYKKEHKYVSSRNKFIEDQH